jgi:hypothetical protein
MKANKIDISNLFRRLEQTEGFDRNTLKLVKFIDLQGKGEDEACEFILTFASHSKKE